jgi:hypothetical protein
MSRRSPSLLSLLAATTALAGSLALAPPPAITAGTERTSRSPWLVCRRATRSPGIGGNVFVEKPFRL